MKTNLYKALLLSVIYIFNLGASHQEKPILCLFYTPSHKVFYKEWLLPSIQDDFEVIIGEAEQECSTATFYSQGWTKTTRKKIKHIVDTIKNNMGRLLIYSDVDIQFFGPIEQDIRELLGPTTDDIKDVMNNIARAIANKLNPIETDVKKLVKPLEPEIKQLITQREEGFILLQRDSPAKYHPCTGFFAFICSQKTLQLWQEVLTHMENNPDISDQRALYEVLIWHKFPIEWDYFPPRYLSGGTLTGRQWKEDSGLFIPEDVLLHHANWCFGVKNKIKQLTSVKNEVNRRKKRSMLSSLTTLCSFLYHYVTGDK